MVVVIVNIVVSVQFVVHVVVVIHVVIIGKSFVLFGMSVCHLKIFHYSN